MKEFILILLLVVSIILPLGLLIFCIRCVWEQWFGEPYGIAHLRENAFIDRQEAKHDN